MNGRVFTSLVGWQPGVADPTEGDEQQTGSCSGVSPSINGGRSEYSNWQVNGGDNQDNGSNGTLVVYPNVDAISEVRVLESSYGAQYGKNGSGTIEVETKSGTKSLHGDLFYYGRNDFLNARSYFADPTAPNPPYNRHDFGYTIGDPLFNPQQLREELLKIHHNIKSKVRATFSYIHDSYLQQTPYTGWGSGSFATFGTNRNGPGVSIVARLTAQFSPTLLNEFVFGYTSNALRFSDNGPWKRSSYPGLFSNSVFANNFGGKVSAFSINDSNEGFGFSVDPSFAPWVNSDPTYSYRDNVSKITGTHSLQFGAYFQAAQKNEDQGAESEGLLNFTNLASSVSSRNGFADFRMATIQSLY